MKYIHTPIDERTLAQFDRVAKRRGISRNALVRDMVRVAIDSIRSRRR